MKNAVLALAIVAIISTGRVSREQAKHLFAVDRNFDTGKNVGAVPLPPPVRAEPIDNHKSLYIYEFKATGCRWSYTVDNETKEMSHGSTLAIPICAT